MSYFLPSSAAGSLKLKRRTESSGSLSSEWDVKCQEGERVMERERNREVYFILLIRLSVKEA